MHGYQMTAFECGILICWFVRDLAGPPSLRARWIVIIVAIAFAIAGV